MAKAHGTGRRLGKAVDSCFRMAKALGLAA
jgi:hypothetical protein